MKWVKIAALVLLSGIILFFALMGYLDATRGTPTREVVAPGDSSGPPRIDDTLFASSIRSLTDTDLRPGHRVEPLFDGNGTYPRFWQDLRSTRSHALIQLYYCKPGVIADSLKTVLRDVAQRQVQLLVMFDAFGCSSLKDAYLDSLRTAGIRVAKLRPVKWYTLHKAQNRSHARVAIIDGQIGYTGGFGIADYWLGDGHSKEHWRETNVRFTGPAIREMQAAFATAWAEATGELLTGSALFGGAPVADSAGATAGLLFAEPAIGSTPAERFLALTIAGAQRRLYISNAYFVPDDDFRRMLKDAARRGVDVRVLTAGKETDVATVRYASRRHYEELLRAGVKIYEYRPTMMHAKTMVADDGWSTIGTMNFDNRSLAFNDETNLLIDDAGVARILVTKFADDLRYSDEIRLDAFRRRSWTSKLLELLASGVAKML
jgi:cardiolipin synthase A/B